MSKEDKLLEFICHLLYRLDGFRVTLMQLKSTKTPLPIEILNLIESEKYQYYIQEFQKVVTYEEDIKNPYGIFKYCSEYAEKNGTSEYAEIAPFTSERGEVVTKKRISYTPNDTEEYRIIILDNYNNLMLERGETKMQCIEKMSKYGIQLRDTYGYSFNAVQHQMQAQESLENIKLNKLEPGAEGLADCKTTIRDVNISFGLFNPFKYDIKNFKGYDITKFRNYIRFLKIIDNREGENNIYIPLFFDGCVAEFKELPYPTDTTGIAKYYKYIEYLESYNLEEVVKQKFNTSFFTFSYFKNKFYDFTHRKKKSSITES